MRITPLIDTGFAGVAQIFAAAQKLSDLHKYRRG
jgi:hypothetical protein